MSKYIKFELVEKKKKTNVYCVIQKQNLELALGFIKWFPAWRRYCFYPEEGIVFDASCLKSIVKFIEKLMDERNILKKKTKIKEI